MMKQRKLTFPTSILPNLTSDISWSDEHPKAPVYDLS